MLLPLWPLPTSSACHVPSDLSDLTMLFPLCEVPFPAESADGGRDVLELGS
jgi:hypothetical protein